MILPNFFTIPPNALFLLSHSYYLSLLFLSFCFTSFIAYIASSITQRIQLAHHILNRSFWLGLGALVLGSNLFAAQFFALLAFTDVNNINYDISIISPSWLLAILNSLLIIHIVTRKHTIYWWYLLATIIINIGLEGMYYACLSAMNSSQAFIYSPWSFPVANSINFILLAIILYSNRLAQTPFFVQHHAIKKHITPIALCLSMLTLHYNALASTFSVVAIDAKTLTSNLNISAQDLGVTLVIVTVLINIAMLIALYFEQGMEKKIRYDEQSDFNWNWQFKKIFLQISLPLTLTILTGAYISGYYYTKSIRIEEHQQARSNIKLATSYAINDLENILTHLYLLKMGLPMQEMLNNDTQTTRQNLAKQFLSVGQTLNLYKQIRFINTQGMEIVRIDINSENKAQVIQDNKLQNKSARDYFKRSILLAENKIYVSALDLNIEQEQVEFPYKPVLRIATPVFDAHGNKQGILILNYHAKIILDNIRAIFSSLKSRVYFLNDQGFFLIGPTQDLEWGFMLNRPENTFAHQFPEAWSMIDQKNNGQINVRYGDFTFQQLNVTRQLNRKVNALKNERSWKVVIHDLPYQWSWQDLINHPLALSNIIVLLLVAFIVAWFSSRAMVARRYAETTSSELLRHLNFQKFALDEHAIVSATDVKGNITYMNDKFCEISGYQREELLGKNHRLIKSDQHSLEFYENMWGTILQGKPWHGEVKNYRKNGDIYWVNATILPFLNEQGKPFKYVSIRTDITQGKQMEHELALALSRAKLATQAKTDFLANMSHEIRTPMNAIVGMSLLSLQTALNPKQKDYVEKIHNAAHNLLGIINNILDFSKIEAGKMEIEELCFHLDEVLDNLSHLISVKVREKNLELLIATDPKVPNNLKGDPLRLNQILINLVNNAVKFTEKGEILLRIELLEPAKNDNDTITLKFSVSDDGIGMNETQLNKLFQSFNQADASTTRKYGGTGLGLSISKELTELMGGKIWAESTPQQGSTFIFTANFKFSEQEKSNTNLATPNLRGLSVLIVDDSATAREILHQLSKALSFQVTLAPSGEEALELIHEADKNNQPFALIFMDWKMPGINGIETCYRIKSDQTLKSPPKVIIVSAYDRNEIIKEIKEYKIDGFLDKPVSSSALLDASMLALGYQKLSRKHRQKQSQNIDFDIVQAIQGAQILLVEDNEVNQQVAFDLLTMAHLNVTLANNGAEALALLQQSPDDTFHCVLMDVQMPVMDGYQATEHLRNDSRFKTLPIIAMTANALISDVEKCKATGMNAHVAKPIDPNEMFSALADWIKPLNYNSDSITTPETPISAEPEISINIPEFNTQQALMRMGGNIHNYRKTLSKVYTSEINAVDRIRQNLNPDKLSEAIRAAHSLKGVAGTIGATQLYFIAGEVETELTNHGNAISEALLGQLETDLQHSMQLIKTALEDSDSTNNTTQPKPPNEGILLAEIIEHLEQISDQIENFDSNAEDNAEILLNKINTDQKQYEFLKQLKQTLGEYDFEAAQNILKNGLAYLKENS